MIARQLQLFDAPKLRVLADKEAQRERLQARVSSLKPRSHRRIGLEAELRLLTHDCLTISNKLGRDE